MTRKFLLIVMPGAVIFQTSTTFLLEFVMTLSHVVSFLKYF